MYIYIFLLFFFNIKKIIIPVFPGDAKNPQVKQKISNSSVRSLLYKSFIRSYSHHTNKEMSRTLIIPEFPPIVSTSKDEIRRDCERKISIVSLASWSKTCITSIFESFILKEEYFKINSSSLRMIPEKKKNITLHIEFRLENGNLFQN